MTFLIVYWGTSLFCGFLTYLVAVVRNKNRQRFFLVGFCFNIFGVALLFFIRDKEDERRLLETQHSALFGAEEKSIKYETNSPELYNDRGANCGNEKRYSMAITNFTRAIELDSVDNETPQARI